MGGFEREGRIELSVCMRKKRSLKGLSSFLGECKLICVYGKKWILFSENYDMQILIEREHFYDTCKGTDPTDHFSK